VADMGITLSSESLEVSVTPERGADIAKVLDRESGTNLLAESPTVLPTNPRLPAYDSMVAWLNGYPGGWQLLAPNAGPEREHSGVRQGFHGEAALASWAVLASDETSCELETYLLTAPLHLRRTVTVIGPQLSVSDTVTNLSPDPTWTRLVQHPAFGSSFLGEDSFLVTSARTIITDADAPGTLAPPNAVDTPQAVLASGPVPHSIRLPGPGSRASLFAALTDFETPEATFYSPDRGFGVRLSWDQGIYPHAWFWIEANASSGWPWFRRLYAVAVEPANVLPGADSLVADHRRGTSGAELQPGQQVTTTTRLTTRLPLPA
jgi:Domain of unknown function (DUF4432)